MSRLTTSFLAVLTLASAGSTVVAVPVDVLTIDGDTFRADWIGLDQAGGFRFSLEGNVQTRPLRTLTEIVPTTEAVSSPTIADPHRLMLVGGGHVRVTLGRSEDGAVSFAHPMKTGQLQFTALAGVWLMDPKESPEAAVLMQTLLQDRPVAEDAVIVIADDVSRRLNGRVLSLSDGVGRIEYQGQTRTLRQGTLFGVVFGLGIQPGEKPKCDVTLARGDVFSADVIGVRDQRLALDNTFAGPVVIDWKDVRKLAFLSDAIRYLSDAEPDEYEFKPFLHTKWPYRLDRSVANGPIRIAGRTFLKGIGVHAHSRLVYTIRPDDETFLCTVGVDDAVGHRGSVRFRILVDGQERFDSRVLKGQDTPKNVRVNVRRGKRLELILEDGGDLDVGDHGNWANARLIRK